jgi:hypothetical protein
MNIHHPGKKGSGFGDSEPEVVGPDFNQLIPCPESGQGQGGIGSCGDKNMNKTGYLLDEPGQYLLGPGIPQEMEVVKNQQKCRACLGNIPCQGCADYFQRRPLH